MHDLTLAPDVTSRSIPSLLLACLLWLLMSAPQLAQAQSSATNKALAESLFDRGLELMRSGKDEEACQTLERSQAIEPGVGTMLYLAECYEKLGRSASAWAMYREAASAAQEQGQTERAKKGATRAEYLTPSLSRLTLVVSSAAALPGLVVTRNGNVVPSAAYGAAVPVDPGEQKLSAAAPGYAAWNLNVDLPPSGARITVDVPVLQALPPSEAPLVAQPSVPQQPLAASAPDASLHPTAAEGEQPLQPSPTFHKPLAYTLGGIGIVALGVGGYFGARAISENNKAGDACPDDRCGTQEGIDHDRSAHRAATAANLLVAGGLALVAAGVVIFITRPREDRLQVSLRSGPGAAQLQLAGSF